jgi:hypothetical protein
VGFFLGYGFLNPLGLAYGSLWGEGGGEEGVCLPFSLSSIFYLWLFSLLVFLIYFDETDSKQPKIHRKIHISLGILNISRKKSANKKSRDFCQMFVISKRKPYTLGYGFKILQKNSDVSATLPWYKYTPM